MLFLEEYERHWDFEVEKRLSVLSWVLSWVYWIKPVVDSGTKAMWTVEAQFKKFQRETILVIG